MTTLNLLKIVLVGILKTTKSATIRLTTENLIGIFIFFIHLIKLINRADTIEHISKFLNLNLSRSIQKSTKQYETPCSFYYLVEVNVKAVMQGQLMLERRAQRSLQAYKEAVRGLQCPLIPVKKEKSLKPPTLKLQFVI